MYKLVVLYAVISAAVAKPSGLVAAPFVAPLTPLAYTSTVVSPAKTTISQQASSVVHPSPLLYSAPFTYAHYLKKRSVGFSLPSTYIAPTTYIAPAYAHTYAAPIFKTSFLAPAPWAYTPAHFIKKRSVGFALPSTYYAHTTYAAPLITTAYGAPLLHSTPYIAPAPITYSHLIKKRSAPLLAASYIAPTSYSSQSRVDIQHSSPLISTTYTAPFAYRYVPGFSHIF